jgi:hypothetical protein
VATYYLMLRDNPEALANVSPGEMQAIVERYVSWRESNSDRVTGGEKLVDGQGLVLRRASGKLSVSDGPFADAKEILGGFFVIEAADDATARALAETCPHLDFGSIEIRRIDAV